MSYGFKEFSYEIKDISYVSLTFLVSDVVNKLLQSIHRGSSMRLLIEVEGQEAVEVMEQLQGQLQGLIKKLEELSDEIAELRETVGGKNEKV